MRRAPRPRPHQPSVAWPRLEQHGRAGGSDRFEIDVGAQAAGHLAIGDERRRAHQAGFLAVGDERQQRPLRPARRGEHPGRLQRHRHAQRIVCRARRVGRGVVMGNDAERVGLLAGKNADDVRDACRSAELMAPRVGFLHAHLEADLLELIDDVFPCAGVCRGPDGPAANGAREHADVSDRVGVVEKAGLARAGTCRRRGQNDQSSGTDAHPPMVCGREGSGSKPESRSSRPSGFGSWSWDLRSWRLSASAATAVRCTAPCRRPHRRRCGRARRLRPWS